MFGTAFSPNKLNPDHTDSPTNSENVSECETISDSEIEDDSSTGKNAEIHRKLGLNQGINHNNLQSTPGVFQPNGLNENAVNSSVTSVTVRKPINARFGNETNFHAPVTINHPEVNQLYQNQEKWKCPNKKTIYILFAVIVISSLLLTVILILTHQNDADDDESIINKEQRIVPRKEWGARPPKQNITKLELPSTSVIIAHTATGNCFDLSECAANVRMIQDYHMDDPILKFSDIGYHFLVGGDGAVYVGRGWDNEGASTLGYNKRSICIAFIGDFTDLKPPKQQLIAAHTIIALGVKQKKLTVDYKLYGQCQLRNMKSPGNALYKIIIKWKHWSIHSAQNYCSN